mmetsp:Transcript_6639/g.24453  ORF Transcript_6639/g.24453 Transcript_6639/m.24453 type:complete len:223 (-) Transcript_6639:1508-2176(-)
MIEVPRRALPRGHDESVQERLAAFFPKRRAILQNRLAALRPRTHHRDPLHARARVPPAQTTHPALALVQRASELRRALRLRVDIEALARAVQVGFARQHRGFRRRVRERRRRLCRRRRGHRYHRHRRRRRPHSHALQTQRLAAPAHGLEPLLDVPPRAPTPNRDRPPLRVLRHRLSFPVAVPRRRLPLARRAAAAAAAVLTLDAHRAERVVHRRPRRDVRLR